MRKKKQKFNCPNCGWVNEGKDLFGVICLDCKNPMSFCHACGFEGNEHDRVKKEKKNV